jgi:hypothetical protein
MPPPVCTMDASSVIALDHLNLLPQLSLLFSRVLLPKAVRSELFRRRSTKNRLRALLESYAFLQRCDDYDNGAVDLLLIERASTGREDRGEAEAVVQAAKSSATRNYFIELLRRGTRLPREVVRVPGRNRRTAVVDGGYPILAAEAPDLSQLLLSFSS